MSFVVLPLRSNGQVIDETWFNLIKNDLDDHETRMLKVEKNDPLLFEVDGQLTGITFPITQAVIMRLQYPITIQSAKLFVKLAGSAGDSECDLEFKRGAGAWTSIFSTLPKLNFSAGSLVRSTNEVLNAPNTILLAGDLLRLNITNNQTDQKYLALIVDYKKD